MVNMAEKGTDYEGPSSVVESNGIDGSDCNLPDRGVRIGPFRHFYTHNIFF